METQFYYHATDGRNYRVIISLEALNTYSYFDRDVHCPVSDVNHLEIIDEDLGFDITEDSDPEIYQEIFTYCEQNKFAMCQEDA